MSKQLNKLISTVRDGRADIENGTFRNGKIFCEAVYDNNKNSKVILILFGGPSDGDFEHDHQGLLIETTDGLKYFDKYGTRQLSEQSLREVGLLNILNGLSWDVLVPEKYENYDEWNRENISWLMRYPEIEELTVEEISKICISRMIY